MKTLSQDELRQSVIAWVRKNGHADGRTDLTVTTNLLESGFLDSFGFVELILFIENQTGSAVDLMNVDIGEFSTVGGLCKIAIGGEPTGREVVAS